MNFSGRDFGKRFGKKSPKKALEKAPQPPAAVLRNPLRGIPMDPPFSGATGAG
jgi:hypothetical protein